MKLTQVLKDEVFGNVEQKVRGIVTYRISPFEQRAFAGVFSLIPNTIRRMAMGSAISVPWFLGSYILYLELEKEYERTLRKNPDDYKNDK